jgi:hypothetical protein
MDIQVNKHQLERVVIKWLNKHFGDLILKKHKEHPKSVFYVNSNNDVIMEYDQENGEVLISYDHIWSKIGLLFHLNYRDIQSIMKVWLEETYKLGGVTPGFDREYVNTGLEETYKLGGVTPFRSDFV